MANHIYIILDLIVVYVENGGIKNSRYQSINPMESIGILWEYVLQAKDVGKR